MVEPPSKVHASHQSTPEGAVPPTPAPGVLTPALARTLSARMGEAELERRLAVEVRRHAGADSRHRSLGRIWAVVVCTAFRLFCKMTFIYRAGHRQFHNLAIRENHVALPGLDPAFDGYRILHLSDLHLDLDPDFPDTLLRAIAQCEYDICVATGDFRNFSEGPDDTSVEILRRVVAAVKAPVYGVLGNHDMAASVPHLEAAGLSMLLNEHVLLQPKSPAAVSVSGAALALVGIDDPNVYQSHNLRRALAGIPAGTPTVLLSHSPCIYGDAAKAGVGLVLSGHLHGGQVCLPGGLFITTPDPSPRRCWLRAWREGETQGYTSTGSGGCGVPLRFFSQGEVVVHVLHAPNNKG